MQLRWLTAVLLAVVSVGHTMASTAVESTREWARLINPTFNLYRMAPGLYRSAKPSPLNVDELHALGVTTVISLIKADDTALVSERFSAHLESFPLHADRVDESDVLDVLRAIAAAPGPVLIHCKHGRDRTGLMAAMYRTVIQGWSRDEAIAEMTAGGFGEPADMVDAVAYVQRADIGAIRTALASGACSPSPFDSCHVSRWLASLL
ncbi:tyrosine-protein phosphatase [Pseudomonas sp. Marseille-QA0892]